MRGGSGTGPSGDHKKGDGDPVVDGHRTIKFDRDVALELLNEQSSDFGRVLI